MAAEASLCAMEQGAFWEYHDILFANQGAFGESNLKRYARDLNLEVNSFETCLKDRRYQSDVENDLDEGRAKGVGSTPTILINGKKITGAQPFEVYQEAIERELDLSR